MPDIVEAVRAYFQQNTNLISLLPDPNRIYGFELPANVASTMPDTAILLGPSGGYIDYTQGENAYYQRLDIRTYGKTSYKAAKLQLACIQALRDLNNSLQGSTMLYNADMETAINYAREGSANWLYCYTVWGIRSYLGDFQPGYYVN